MFGPSILYMTAGKGEEDSFNTLSLNLSLPPVSSSLSIWSLLLDSQAFLSVKSFCDTRSDFSLKDKINPYTGLLKNDNFSIKTTND